MCPLPTNEERDENRFHPNVTENPSGGLLRRPDIRRIPGGYLPSGERVLYPGLVLGMSQVKEEKTGRGSFFLDFWPKNSLKIRQNTVYLFNYDVPENLLIKQRQSLKNLLNPQPL